MDGKTDVEMLDICLTKEQADDAKRQLREPLLQAYDSHKSTVIYENGMESEEEKAIVLAWKKAALDLETSAFREEEIPNSVKYYL